MLRRPARAPEGVESVLLDLVIVILAVAGGAELLVDPGDIRASLGPLLS
jgi:hypothetical protein